MRVDAEILGVSLASDVIGKEKLQPEQREEKMERAKEGICARQHRVRTRALS
jgi:hypothetical protein